MVVASGLLSLASVTTKQHAAANMNPVEPNSRVVATAVPSRPEDDDDDEEPINRTLDIAECIKVAMRKCQGEIDQARVSEETVVIQKGLAAEEILKLLGGLVDLRWSSVLKSEIETSVGGGSNEGSDLRQRMELSWKNHLITKLKIAEVHIKKFIETLVVVEPHPSIPAVSYTSAPMAAPASPQADLRVQATPPFVAVAEEEKAGINDVICEPSPTPVKSEQMPSADNNEWQAAKVAPTTPLQRPPNTKLADYAADNGNSPPGSTRENAEFRGTHRRLKPPKNGKVVPTVLTDLDVPRGRGGVINRHPGHQFLLSRVCAYRDQYKAARRGAKELLAKRLVREIQERNGRFLDYLINEEGNKTWYEIDDEASIKVVQQKLREFPARMKDKGKGTASDTDEGSGAQNEGDPAMHRPEVLSSTGTHATEERKAKGEHEAAMMLLSL